MVNTEKVAYAAKTINEYMVIGRCLQYAVVRTENGEIYCLEDEAEVLNTGDICNGELLIPVSSLPLLLQKVISVSYGREVV